MVRIFISIQITVGLLFSGVPLLASARPLSAAFTSCANITQIPQSECEALVALYNSTNGNGWGDHTNWLASDTPGNWYGITLTAGHVSGIQLEFNQLTGTLPTQIGNLPNLRNLYLNQNQLSGNIPTTLGGLTNLNNLYLYNNQLSGSIPTALGSLTNLNDLSLWGNQLSGSIPTELGNLTNLQSLWLNTNQLSGNIPAALGNLTNLNYLYLQNNLFDGSIPSELGNLTSLTHLEIGNDALSATRLSGSIPTQLGNLTNLVYLSINQTDLNGSIPSELGNLTQLKQLFLFDNELSDSIPSALGNLTDLEELSLWGNNLTGSIPPEIGNLVNLKYIYLGFNELSGSIPAQMGNMTHLQEMWLHYNQLSGSIPPELGNLANLQGMWLRSNQISGSIPTQLGNLSNLSYLYLDNNLLSGSIPAQLGNLSNLSYLFLGQNQLEGSIPPDLGNLTNLQFLDIRNDHYSAQKISGNLPPELGNLENLKELVLNNNQLSGSIPSDFNKLYKLEKLSLWDNQLSGEIPSWLGNLTGLKYVYLGFNQFTGTIPSQIGNLANLEELWLYNNQLTGSIPTSFGNLTSLTQMRLDNNQITGNIPAELGNLPQLQYLYLSNNQLSGSIPSSLGNLTTLTQLFLNNNLLGGDVPPVFTQLVNLYNPGEAPNSLDGLDIGHNYLNYPASTSELITFLAQKDPDWASTQGIPNPTPNLIEINPGNILAGSGSFMLAVTGTNFINGATVRWNGSDLTTTYGSATQLIASVPAANIATGGVIEITVSNPAPSGDASNDLIFTINNPAPALSGIDPTTVTAGSTDFTLTVNGSNFITGSKVRWNGSDLATTYVNTSQLTALVPAANITTGGTIEITVFNPAPNGGTTSAISFVINNPLPTLDSLNPANVLVGSASFTLIVNGTGFINGSVVRWNGSDLPTSYVGATQLTATVPNGNLTDPAIVNVAVFNPAPGGGVSNVLPFIVNSPIPVLSSINPMNAVSNSSDFTLTVKGNDFVSNSVIQWNGAELTTTYVSATQLTASVKTTNLSSIGTANITVFNPAPNGGTSNTLVFLITAPGERGTSIQITPGSASSLSFINTTNPVLTTLLEVPVGTVNAPTQLSYVEMPFPSESEPPQGFIFGGRYFALSAYVSGVLQPGLIFLQPVRLTLTYPNDTLSFVENTLELRYWDSASQQWSNNGITVISRNPANHTVVVEITHISEFALMGKASRVYLPVIQR